MREKLHGEDFSRQGITCYISENYNVYELGEHLCAEGSMVNHVDKTEDEH